MSVQREVWHTPSAESSTTVWPGCITPSSRLRHTGAFTARVCKVQQSPRAQPLTPPHPHPHLVGRPGAHLHWLPPLWPTLPHSPHLYLAQPHTFSSLCMNSSSSWDFSHCEGAVAWRVSSLGSSLPPSPCTTGASLQESGGAGESWCPESTVSLLFGLLSLTDEGCSLMSCSPSR